MKPLLALMPLALATCLHAATVAEREAAYVKAAHAVIDMANAKAVDAQLVAAQVLLMEQQAVPLAQAYAARFPAGKGVIDTVIAQVAVLDGAGAMTGFGPMQELSYEVIEKQWHDLGHFKVNKPTIDLTDEDNEHFTDPLHAMIHPLMVLRAARTWQTSKSDKDLQAMKEEMDEGIEQVQKTSKAVAK